MNTNTNNASTQGSDYHNESLSGFAYLNDIREVKSRKGSFIAVRVKLLQGEKANPKALYLNCNVFGQAAELLAPHMAASQKEGEGVRGRIKISDLELRTYTSKTNEIRPALYGRLFAISVLFVGEEKVYSRADEQSAEQQQEAPVLAATGTSSAGAQESQEAPFDDAYEDFPV